MFITLNALQRSLGNNAFRDSGLTSLELPGSLTTIGSRAFSGCSALAGSLTIPNSVTSVGSFAFIDCSALTGSLTLSNKLTVIESTAFRGCGFTGTLTIPNSVLSIGYQAFYDCQSFTSVIIPKSVTTIDDTAFGRLFSLTDVTVYWEDDPPSIDAGVFQHLSPPKINLHIPECIQSIYAAAPVWKDFNFVQFWEIGAAPNPASVIATFTSKNNTLTITGNGEMKNWDFNEPDMPPWYQCGLKDSIKSVFISGDVETIGNYVFYDCFYLTSIEILDGVTKIGDNAFQSCCRLTSVEIPITVNIIGQYAFSWPWCGDGLADVIVHWDINEIPSIGYNVFVGYDLSNINLYVPAGLECEYKTVPIWGGFNVVGAFRTIIPTAGANGTILPSVPTDVSCGTNQTFYFTPDAGYRIDMVWVDGVENITAVENGFYTFDNVTENHTIIVSFILDFCGDGDGTAGNPYQICTAEQLANLAKFVNAGNPTDDIYYKLMNNIDLSVYAAGAGWTPIGNGNNWFQGNFNGDEYSIYNLKINRPTSGEIGLFGFTAGGTTIQNLFIENCDISALHNIGGLVGSASVGTTISDCRVTGSIAGNNEIGGLVGRAFHSSIKNCTATCNIVGNNHVGGLVGHNNSHIKDCTTAGTVEGNSRVGGLIGVNFNDGPIIDKCHTTATVTGISNVGGLVGMNTNESEFGGNIIISDCSASGNVSGQTQIGGLVGMNDPVNNATVTISNCHAIGNVSGNSHVGGLVGYNYNNSTITESHATGKITGNSRIGGLIGVNYDTFIVIDCYATGTVNGNSDLVGGLVGDNRNSTISNCYANGDVEGNNFIGGLVGFLESSTVENCYTTNNVNGNNRVGGLAGMVQTHSTVATISNCYAVGENIIGNNDVGGLVGHITDAIIQNCVAAHISVIATSNTNINRIVGFSNNSTYCKNYAYEDMVVEANGTIIEITEGTNAAGIGKDMQTLKSFDFYNTAANWCEQAWSIDKDINLAKIWLICEHGVLPYFQWQPPVICPYIIHAIVENGTIDPEGYITVNEGENQTFYFETDGCSYIVEVLIDGIDNEKAKKDGYYTFVNVTQDHTIKVVFGKYTYNVTVLANPEDGGTVTGGGTNIDCGEEIIIKAIPKECDYKFKYWTKNGVLFSENDEETIIVMEHSVFIAHFELAIYTINGTPNNGTPNPTEGCEVSGSGTYFCNNEVTLTAITTDPCLEFVNWTEGDVEVSKDNPFIFLATKDRNLVANFKQKICFITVSPEPIFGGWISVNPPNYQGIVFFGDDVPCGEEITVTADPFPGYGFDKWTINGEEVSKNNPYKFTVTELCAPNLLVAHFVLKNDYTITIIKEGCDGTVLCWEAVCDGGTYSYGDSLQLKGVTDSCCKFVQWMENGMPIVGTVQSFIVKEDRTLTAVFEPQKYNVTVTNGEGGGTNLPVGTVITVTANPADDCWKFVNWTIDEISVSEDASYEYTVPCHNVTLTANFEPILYTVTVTANPTDGGTVIGGGTNLPVGTVITVTATPADDCWKFVNWTIDGIPESNNASYEYTVPCHHVTLTANFEEILYTVTPLVGSGGSIFPNTSQFVCGKDIIFTADPDYCQEVYQWKKDGNFVQSGGLTYKVLNVQANTTVEVTFKDAPPYTITATAVPLAGGIITPSGAVVVPCDKDQKFEFKPNTGYVIDDVLIDGVSNSGAVAAGSYTFTNVTANHTIHVTFKQSSSSDQYTVTLLADPVGCGTVDGGGTYGVNTKVKVYALNGKFKNWTENGVEVSTKNPYEFTVTKDRELVANFDCDTPSIETIETTTFKVYPNPTSGELTIDFGKLPINNAEYTIYSLIGQLLMQGTLQGNETMTLNVESLPSGMYFLKIGDKMAKFVKQ